MPDDDMIRTARMELRLTRAEKHLLELAAVADGVPVADLVRAGALREARERMDRRLKDEDILARFGSVAQPAPQKARETGPSKKVRAKRD